MNLSAIMTDSRYPGIASNKLWYEAFSTSPVAFPVRYPDGRWAGPPANAGSNPMNEVQNAGTLILSVRLCNRYLPSTKN